MLSCLATYAQKPHHEIWTESFRQSIEDKKGTYSEDVEEAMAALGKQKNVDYWCFYMNPEQVHAVRFFIKGRRAILQVPSLNREGAQHAIYWDGFRIHDPSNLQVYKWIDQCYPS